MARRIILAAVSLMLGFLCGCASRPSKREVTEQLERHELFAQPEVLYICLGVQTKENDPYCMSGYFSKARDLDLITYSDLEMQPVMHPDRSLHWIPRDAALKGNETAVVSMVGPDGSQWWIPKGNVPAATKVGGKIPDVFDVVSFDEDQPVAMINLTSKGKQFLKGPGSISTDGQAGFVVAHREILGVTKITRLGPDSMVAEFQWRDVPTDVGKLFDPTRGLLVRSSKALFRIDQHKRWKLMDPRPESWETDDPSAKEFDLYEQILAK